MRLEDTSSSGRCRSKGGSVSFRFGTGTFFLVLMMVSGDFMVLFVTVNDFL